MIPTNVVNKKLYVKAKAKATRKFGAKSSAYRSMNIVKNYKSMGGKYSGKKPKSTGLNRWNSEKWLAVIPYLDGKRVKCSATLNKKVACRPSLKKSKSTPITVQQVVKLHGKTKTRKLARAKGKNMSRRVNWKKGTIK